MSIQQQQHSGNRRRRLLIVAPARSARGGITTAVTRLMQSESLMHRQALWLETMDDRNLIYKVVSLLLALLRMPAALISANIVHVHISSETSFFRKCLFLMAATLTGRRTIAHIHPTHFIDFFKRSSALKKRFIAATLKRVNMVVVLSSVIGECLQRLLPLRQMRVIPNPCPYDPIPSTEWRQRGSTVLFCGKIMDTKGCRELFSAFILVIGRFPDAQLIMAGNGDRDRFAALAEKLGIAKNVSFPGWLSGEDLLNAYRNAAIFCLPSYSEGLPMSILEAMSQGAVVITTPVGGIPDIIKNGKNGLLVPTKDSDALAKALCCIFVDSRLCAQFAQAGLETIRKHFSLQVISAMMENVYREVEA